ncbi:hypothetical protein MY11210_008520 [Beauveria gryllotalpidicola]
MALATKDFAPSLPAPGDTTVCNTLSPWVHLAAGASGGLVNSIATSPLDVLRTRMQSDTYATATQSKFSIIQRLRHVHPIRETIDALGTIHGIEGIRGLFRGLVPSLIGVVPAQAVKFYVYGNCKRLGAQYLGLKEAEPLVHAQAAVAAGLATATATNPIWLIFKTEGVAGFYRGLSASYLGTLETVVHLVLYERLKTLFQAQSYYSSSSPAHRSELENWASTAGAAGCAKMAAVLITYPHEVVRTRLRQAPVEGSSQANTGLVQCCRSTWAREGWRGFYSGLTPHLLRSIPSAVITLAPDHRSQREMDEWTSHIDAGPVPRATESPKPEPAFRKRFADSFRFNPTSLRRHSRVQSMCSSVSSAHFLDSDTAYSASTVASPISTTWVGDREEEDGVNQDQLEKTVKSALANPMSPNICLNENDEDVDGLEIQDRAQNLSDNDASMSGSSDGEHYEQGDATSPRTLICDTGSVATDGASGSDADTLLTYTLQLIYGIDAPEREPQLSSLRRMSARFIRELGDAIWQSPIVDGDGRRSSQSGASSSSSKRKQDESPGGEDQGNGQGSGFGPMKKAKHSAKEDANLRLSCPFRKRNPNRFNCFAETVEQCLSTAQGLHYVNRSNKKGELCRTAQQAAPSGRRVSEIQPRPDSGIMLDYGSEESGSVTGSRLRYNDSTVALSMLNCRDQHDFAFGDSSSTPALSLHTPTSVFIPELLPATVIRDPQADYTRLWTDEMLYDMTATGVVNLNAEEHSNWEDRPPHMPFHESTTSLF